MKDVGLHSLDLVEVVGVGLAMFSLLALVADLPLMIFLWKQRVTRFLLLS